MKKIFGIITIGFLLGNCGSEDVVTFEEQLAIDVELIDNYLNENGISAQAHETGIRFEQTEVGGGSSPQPNEVAVIKFDFRVLGSDAVVGFSEYGDSFTLDEFLMRALFYMLQEMQEGGKMTIYAPSVYAFGNASSDAIPPNSNLIFNIELLSVVTTASEQFSADTTIIENYLDANGIKAFVHESGIRYTVQEEGSGDYPSSSDIVRVAYEGRFLYGTVFDTNPDGISFTLSNLIEAWQIMIPTMKPGGKITIYAPSTYCYGTTGSGSIPSNTNLVFDIELLAIE